MTDASRRLRVTDVDDGTDVEIEPPAPTDDATTGAAGPSVMPIRVTRLGEGRQDIEAAAPRYEVVAGGWRFRFAVDDAHRARLRERAGRAAAEHGPQVPQTIRAQIPGRIVSVAVAPGDHVVLGQPLLAVEAMKMENEVRATRAGTVEAVHVTAGARVELGDELVRIV